MSNFGRVDTDVPDSYLNGDHSINELWVLGDQHDFTFDILMDPVGITSENYNADNLPMTYIIDKQGKIIRRAIGPRIWDGPESVALFEKLVAQ